MAPILPCFAPTHLVFFFFNDTATTEIYTLSLHDALPISPGATSNDTSQAATTAPVVGLIAVPCAGPVPATVPSGSTPTAPNTLPIPSTRNAHSGLPAERTQRAGAGRTGALRVSSARRPGPGRRLSGAR